MGWRPEFAERYRRAGYGTGHALAAGLHRWAPPDSPALVDGPTRISHGRLAELSDGLAERLAGRGLERGGTILVQLPDY